MTLQLEKKFVSWSLILNLLSWESTSFVNLTQLKKIRFNGGIEKDLTTRWIICEQLYNKFDNNWIIFILIRKSFIKYTELRVENTTELRTFYLHMIFFPVSLFRDTKKKLCQIKWFRYSDFSFLKHTANYVIYRISNTGAICIKVSLFLVVFFLFLSFWSLTRPLTIT